MPTTAKQYSVPYWTKHALRYQSNPEPVITAAVRSHHLQDRPTGIAFEGSAHTLLNQIYIEHRKQMKSVHLGLFPTPMPVARQLAELMGIQPNSLVLDPSAGLGNLLVAASEFTSHIIGIEFQYWLPELLSQIGIPCSRGDFLDIPIEKIPTPDIILTNPPYGRIGEVSDATTAHMARIADIAPPGTPVGAILPTGHFERGPKARAATAERFTWHKAIDLPPDTFKPLTNVSTTLHRLTVR